MALSENLTQLVNNCIPREQNVEEVGSVSGPTTPAKEGEAASGWRKWLGWGTITAELQQTPFLPMLEHSGAGMTL